MSENLKQKPRQFQAAYMLDDGTASVIRFGSGMSESKATHKAIRIANAFETNTCVVNERTGEVVERVYFYGKGGDGEC